MTVRQLVLVGLVGLGTSGCDASFVAEEGARTTDGAPAGPGLDGGMVTRGSLSGRNGYSASGSVMLQSDGNAFEICFGDNVRVSSGPNLVVVLSSEAALGRRLEATDRNLGSLLRTTGASCYRGTGPPARPDFVHIYCSGVGASFGTAEMR